MRLRRRRHFDLATGIIRVERAWDPKCKVYVDPKSRAGRRRVPILGVLRDVLIDLRMAGPADGLVIPGTLAEHFDASFGEGRTARGKLRAWTPSDYTSADIPSPR